jgi:hypothetical protein
VYIATDTYTVYFCFVAGFWTGTRMGFFDDLADGFFITGGSPDSREFTVTGGDLALVMPSAGVAVTLGKSTKCTQGLCLDQGSEDDEILALKSSDIAHGVTDLANTDVFGTLQKHVAANGGLRLSGFTEGSGGLIFAGVGVSENTTKSTAAVGAVIVQGKLKSGTGAGNLGANANIMAILNNDTARFILDADGDSHQDVGTAWTNFDAFDDAALLTDLSLAVSQAEIRSGKGLESF